MVKSTLRNILKELSGKKLYLNYKVVCGDRASTGRVEVRYFKGYIAIKWDEDKLEAILGNHPPLSFNERQVVDFYDKQIIITVNEWKIYLDVNC